MSFSRNCELSAPLSTTPSNAFVAEGEALMPDPLEWLLWVPSAHKSREGQSAL